MIYKIFNIIDFSSCYPVTIDAKFVESPLQIHFFMQNEPNFLNTPMNVNAIITTRYENKTNWTPGENEPKTNPIKPQKTRFQTQSNPIKPNFKPDQTQNNLKIPPSKFIIQYSTFEFLICLINVRLTASHLKKRKGFFYSG